MRLGSSVGCGSYLNVEKVKADSLIDPLYASHWQVAGFVKP